MKKIIYAVLLIVLIPAMLIAGNSIWTSHESPSDEKGASMPVAEVADLTSPQEDGERILSSIDFENGRIDLVAVRTTIIVLDDNKTAISKEMIDTGVVRISYNSGNDKIAKITIEKDGKRYVYSLRHDGVAENFPLQMGNGDYIVTILENIADNKYTIIRKDTVNLNITDEKKIFMASIQNINWSSTSKAIVKANELTKSCKTDKEKIDVLYNYMVKNYTYDYEKLKTVKPDYIPDIDRTLAEGKGICYDYSSLFASMLRSQGIPVKLVKGYTDYVEGYHAWNSIYLSNTDKWVTVDTTYDAAVWEAKQKLVMAKEDSKYRPVNIY